MTTALFVGRFQPFHKGHLAVIMEILKSYDNIIIEIGSSQEKNTRENPFSAPERIQMIKLGLKEAGIDLKKFTFVKIPDTFDDIGWVEKALKAAGKFEAAYTNNELTKYCFQYKGVKTHGTLYFAPYKGELIRRKIAKGKPWEDSVQKSVFEYILKIKGDTRIKKLSKGKV